MDLQISFNFLLIYLGQYLQHGSFSKAQHFFPTRELQYRNVLVAYNWAFKSNNMSCTCICCEIKSNLSMSINMSESMCVIEDLEGIIVTPQLLKIILMVPK